jgi:glycosyltransferase involved in cell wall biosynthesis
MTRRNSSDLRIAFYDAAGRGGVAQYTYFLAEALAETGARVTLLTGHDYEMRAMVRGFRFVAIFRPSRIGAVLAWTGGLLGGLRKRFSKKTMAAAPEVTGGGRSLRVSEGKLGGLRRVRMRMLLAGAALRLLATRTRLVHVEWGGAIGDEMWFLRLLKRVGIRTVHTAHDLLPHEGAEPDHEEEHRQLYAAADHVVVLAEETRKELIGSFGLPPGRVTAIPHGGDEVFTSVRRDEARKDLSIDPGARVILFFGTVKPYKGLEYLVQAFDGLRTRIPGVLLLVAGGARPSLPDEAAYYETLMADLRSRPDVLTVPEYVPVDRIGLYFSAADVVALPYVLTYHSGVLLHAYAMGKPVVVTDTGGLGEAVEEGRSGYVVAPRDVEALAARLQSILELPDRGAAMGRRARELSEELYSWKAVAQRHAELYRRLLEPGAVEPRRGTRESRESLVAAPETVAPERPRT